SQKESESVPGLTHRGPWIQWRVSVRHTKHEILSASRASSVAEVLFLAPPRMDRDADSGPTCITIGRPSGVRTPSGSEGSHEPSWARFACSSMGRAGGSRDAGLNPVTRAKNPASPLTPGAGF